MSSGSDTSRLQTFLADGRRRVEQALDAALPSPPACPAIVSEAMRYSLSAGGKRLRPLLVLAAADAVARERDPGQAGLALPAACAVEMIHTYSLIHDDLPAMDNDTLRRGRPTLHVVYGDGIAILAGDALQAEAFALLARSPAGDAPDLTTRKLRTIQVIAEAAGAVGMVGGQGIDLQAAGQALGRSLTLDADTLRDMHLRKTGALIRASAVAGAIMAGGNADQIGAVDRWATDIGLAFQIVDDILDVEGNATELGKTAGKDRAGAKPTYPSLFGLEASRRMAADCASRAHDTLTASGLGGSHLSEVAAWVLARRN